MKKRPDFYGHFGIRAKAIALGVLSVLVGLGWVIFVLASATTVFPAIPFLSGLWAIFHFKAAAVAKEKK